MATQSIARDQSPTRDDRERSWTLLDRRPTQAEIVDYDHDERTEVRRLTDEELDMISRASRTRPSLNKETKAFLDATTIVRALSRVAEDRFERGTLDSAARTVINAIRWERHADGLFLSGGVMLPRTDPTRLWYLLAEIYVRMDERDLALKTMQKASTNVGELMERPLPELLARGPSGNSNDGDMEADSGTGGGEGIGGRISRVSRNRYFIGGAVLLLALAIFAAIQAQTASKNMIDSNSVGVDYLGIAFRDGNQSVDNSTILLAGERFSRLDAQLDSWRWMTSTSSLVPPIHDQYVAMTMMGDLGSKLVAFPYASTTGRLSDRGSIEGICTSADKLESFDGNLMGQLEKNRTQMLQVVYKATGGVCGLE